MYMSPKKKVLPEREENKMDDEQFNQLIGILNNIKEHEESISKKLNVLISPIFKKEGKKQDKKITQSNIKTLNNCGLDYKEIANILDMSSGTVANELTALKNKKGGKKNAKNRKK